ncbi:MAG: guanosine monophosphate reductase, partial [Nitrosopumilaceae archaeon]|nr:IMP dehydrogenase [Nitrosopumilaceae archaeon]NIU87915.1 guanosine monophosphate reductase [Nitrosopumilaceae archaeon]NIV66203.1 guanosine monophosphate reductase [Nitrosopumilaceae archaeon]NIX62090.1 guanosine monophosphate reductase [Nitrosopumilaceae archaeon]
MATWIDKEGLTFDDVLLVPQYTEIPSRTHVNLKTNLTKKIKIDIPIVSANM